MLNFRASRHTEDLHASSFLNGDYSFTRYLMEMQATTKLKKPFLRQMDDIPRTDDSNFTVEVRHVLKPNIHILEKNKASCASFYLFTLLLRIEVVKNACWFHTYLSVGTDACYLVASIYMYIGEYQLLC